MAVQSRACTPKQLASCPLVGGTRLIAGIVGTVIFVCSLHQDDTHHHPVHAFIGRTMSGVSTEVWQAQLPACVLVDVHCLTHVPGDAKILPMAVFLFN